MARIEVTGVVKRQFFNLKGVEIAEQLKGQDGQVYEKKWTAWLTNEKELSLGSTITIVGNHSDKVDHWMDEHGNPKLDRNGNPGVSVTRAINDAMVTAGGEVSAGAYIPNTNDPF